MKAVLDVLGDLCCDGGWTSGINTNSFGHTQHFCKPANKWRDNTVVFLFNDGAQSSILPASNFFSIRHKNGEELLELHIVSSNNENKKTPSVLGKQFFANQWIEVDMTRKLRVGFGAAVSAKDKWG